MGTWSPLGGEKMALIGQIRNRGALCGVLTPWPRAGCRAPAPGTCCSGRASLGLGLLNGLLGFGAVSWGLGMAPNPGCADRKCVQLWGGVGESRQISQFCLGRLPKENWSRSTAIPISAPSPSPGFSTPTILPSAQNNHLLTYHSIAFCRV